MKISGNSRRKSALLLSSTVGLALTLAGCTSVEVASKGDAIEPKIASSTPTPATTGTEVASATPAAQNTAAPAAAAAIDAQVQPQPQTQQVALAAAEAPTPATTAVMHQANTAALPQVVAMKGAFPPAPGAPGTPSAAAVPLTEEMMKQQSVIPMSKPQTGAMLAYASAPQNAALAAISTREGLTPSLDAPSMAGKQKLSGLITKYASMYNVPEDLVHRVVMRESRYNPNAVNRGHFGLMQIKHATARSMGFDGPASGLFDAETNLKYAVKYLRGAWMVADNDRDNAVRLYARGYYYDAKRKGMLHVLRK